MAQNVQKEYEEDGSFKIDPTFEFNAPKCYDFLHQDTEEELRACDEFFSILSSLAYQSFLILFYNDYHSSFTCLTSRNTSNVTLLSTKNASRIYGNG